MSCHVVKNTLLAKVSLLRDVAQGVAHGRGGASPLALSAGSCGQDSASNTPGQCLAASWISKTDQKPKAAHPPHSPAQERNWGWQRKVNQARGLIHPPAPSSGAFQAVLLQGSILCAAIYPYTRLPLILCQADSPEAPRAESVINQAEASIQDTHSLCCSAEK